MKTKMKKMFYIVAALGLTAPTIVSAKWDSSSLRSKSGLPSGTIWDIIENTMNWGLGILGFIAIIGFVISGILYLTAAGVQTRIDQAKKAMSYSIIGVIVALAGYVIIKAVENALNARLYF